MNKKETENTKLSEENIDKSEILKKNLSKEKNKDVKPEIDESSENNLEEDIDTKEKIALKKEVEQLKNEKLRLLADMENLRKRTDKERLDSIKYGSINLARDILSPDDNLKRALDAIPQKEKNSETINNLIDGLKMVQKEFLSILEKHGVKKIIALKEKFDHNFHQAMVEIESDEVEEGTVIQEMQSGYTMYDRLLRPSMVGVSKKPSQNDNDEEKA